MSGWIWGGSLGIASNCKSSETLVFAANDIRSPNIWLRSCISRLDGFHSDRV